MSSYWRKREEEALRQYLKTEKEYIKEMNRIYQNMLDNIQKEIDSFYIKYADKEGISITEAKKRVSKLDIEAYERKAEKYVKNKDFSEQANEEMRLYNLTMKVNRLELLKAQIGLELVSGYDELQKFFEEILTDRTIETFERQAGILGSSVGDVKLAAGVIVNASFHNAKFSERIWGNMAVLRSDIDKLLQVGLIQGRNPRVLARDLRRRHSVSKSDAERLMRTELARVQVEAQLQVFWENEINQYEYVACYRQCSCNSCKALDGKRFDVKNSTPGENTPPMHPNCHCSVCGCLDEANYKEWLDSYKEHGLNYKEWRKI